MENNNNDFNQTMDDTQNPGSSWSNETNIEDTDTDLYEDVDDTQGEEDSSQEGVETEQETDENGKKFDPASAKIPYSKWKEDYEEKKYWKQKALELEQKATTVPTPQPIAPKTPQEIEEARQAEAYRQKIKELGFVPSDELTNLQEKLNSIEEKQRKDEFDRRVETIKTNLDKQARDLSKKFDGSNGLKFEYSKFTKDVQKNPKLMQMLKNGFPMEDAFILQNRQQWAAYVTTNTGQPVEIVNQDASDTGGEVDTSKMSSAQIEEYLARKSGKLK